jgi:mono/diheme cytochrome c family protein
MSKSTRFSAALAAVLIAAGVLSFAQNPGVAVYKTKCLNCHGAAGMADTTMARTLKVKPISDPEVKKMSLQAMIDATRNGMGKMQPYKNSLTEAEIKGSVDYFRSFLK